MVDDPVRMLCVLLAKQRDHRDRMPFVLRQAERLVFGVELGEVLGGKTAREKSPTDLLCKAGIPRTLVRVSSGVVVSGVFAQSRRNIVGHLPSAKPYDRRHQVKGKGGKPFDRVLINESLF